MLSYCYRFVTCSVAGISSWLRIQWTWSAKQARDWPKITVWTSKGATSRFESSRDNKDKRYVYQQPDQITGEMLNIECTFRSFFRTPDLFMLMRIYSRVRSRNNLFMDPDFIFGCFVKDSVMEIDKRKAPVGIFRTSRTVFIRHVIDLIFYLRRGFDGSSNERNGETDPRLEISPAG